MIEFLPASFYTITVAIVLVCLGAFWISRHNTFARRAEACAAFRSTVLRELSPVYPQITDWPNDMDGFLRSKFAALQKAVELFKPFVSAGRRQAFNDAWLNYYCTDSTQAGEQTYLRYSASRDPHAETAQHAGARVRRALHSNVYRFLSYADSV